MTLRELREGRGLTLEELAEAAGLSKGFLSQVENGKVGIGLWSARMLADVLQVSLDDLAVLVDRARREPDADAADCELYRKARGGGKKGGGEG